MIEPGVRGLRGYAIQAQRKKAVRQRRYDNEIRTNLVETFKDRSLIPME